MVWSYSLFLAKQIITPYHAAQKVITKDQHALVMAQRVTSKQGAESAVSEILKISEQCLLVRLLLFIN